MEKSPPSKRAPAVGCDDERQAFRDGIGVDDQWNYKSIYQGQSRCGPVRACGVQFCLLSHPALMTASDSSKASRED